MLIAQEAAKWNASYISNNVAGDLAILTFPQGTGRDGTTRMIIPIRVLVCGGERYADRDTVFEALDRLVAEYNSRILPTVGAVHLTIIHGAKRIGVDLLADEWAELNKASVCEFTGYWKGATPPRNQEMLDESRPDVVVAFPGDRTALDLVTRAQAIGIRVLFIPWKRDEDVSARQQR